MGLLAFISTRFGTVIKGKYQGCKFALGSDKKGMTATFNQFLFIKGFKELARVHVVEVAEHEEISDSPSELVLKLTWKDDTYSIIKLPRLDSQGKPWVNDRVGMVQRSLEILDEIREEDN